MDITETLPSLIGQLVRVSQIFGFLSSTRRVFATCYSLCLYYAFSFSQRTHAYRLEVALQLFISMVHHRLSFVHEMFPFPKSNSFLDQRRRIVTGMILRSHDLIFLLLFLIYCTCIQERCCWLLRLVSTQGKYSQDPNGLEYFFVKH